DDLLRAIRQRTEGAADDALSETLATQAGAAMDWLSGLGARFIKGGAQEGFALVAAPPRPLGHSLNWLESWRGRGPDVLLRLLGERLAGNGGVLCRGARARELVMSEGRCVGV